MTFAAAWTLGAAEDPAGWTAAKWGMTDAQILQALPGQAVPLDPPQIHGLARVQIKSLDLAGTKFSVTFVSDEKGCLSSVLLHPSDKGPLDSLFQTLENMLVEKYGRPWSSNADHETKIQWSLKATTITLSHLKYPGLPVEILNLQYKRKDPDLDKM
jgi:hypothetical protein